MVIFHQVKMPFGTIYVTTASESDSRPSVIFHVFSALLTCLLSGHLPGGVYDNPYAQFQEETM